MTTKKPAKNHPWRTGPSFEVLDWARKEAYIRPIQSFDTGRLQGLKRKNGYKQGAY